MLQHEGVVAAAKARADTFDADNQSRVTEGDMDVKLNSLSKFKLNVLPTMNTTQRVEEYVTNHSAAVDNGPSAVGQYSAPNYVPHMYTGVEGQIGPHYNMALHNPQMYTGVEGQTGPLYNMPSQNPVPQMYTRVEGPTGPLYDMPSQNPVPQMTVPNTTRLQPSAEADQSVVGGWFEYFARKDLVVQGLDRFDDKPENFRAWKLSFKNAIKEAKLTSSEEMDLLVKWTGPKSQDVVKKIRSVNIHDPKLGLQEIWNRLEESYGKPETVTNALLKMIKDFPRLKGGDNQKLRELGDLLAMLKSARAAGDLPGLVYLDTYLGVNEIVQKLPYGLQEKWRSKGREYKERHNVPFPPFDYFASFVRKLADDRNDPSFDFGNVYTTSTPRDKKYGDKRYGEKQTDVKVFTKKTSVNNPGFATSESESEPPSDPNKECPIHRKPHPLRKCKEFRNKPLQERLDYLKELRLCFRCCASTEHMARRCTYKEKCTECGSWRHHSALHDDSRDGPSSNHGGENSRKNDGGENKPSDNSSVLSTCTEVCGDDTSFSKSCAKICLVKIYPTGKSDMAERVYALLDDQSNKSLVRPELFSLLKLEGKPSPYTLRTCAGRVQATGRRASGLTIESLDSKTTLSLPTMIECEEIPDNRAEIPTPSAAKQHKHLLSIADCIPDVDNQAQIMVLLGRDILQVHKVREQRNGPGNAPFAQRLDLGWVIVGDVCLNGAHRPDCVNTHKTYVLDNGRTSFLRPCPNRFVVSDSTAQVVEAESSQTVITNENKNNSDSSSLEKDDVIAEERKETFCQGGFEDGIAQTVFRCTEQDNKLGSSVEDRKFLTIMKKEMVMDDSNRWVAPLPFKEPRTVLSNNREMAHKRLVSLQRSLDRKPTMREHYFKFMQDLFDNGHAELAPPLNSGEECWYLPHFGVYHPRKRDKVRVVFDSSCEYKGTSLNSVLLSGPDLLNSLLGVLLRFRHERTAFVADVKQMFYSFVVKPDHRNFLRFLWHKENDPSDEIVEYRMKVHIFGNSPSPAVAAFGLKKTAEAGEMKYGSDARRFVDRNFYVDDGLKSTHDPGEAIDLLQRTKLMLADANLILHKIASNSTEVMQAFPRDDHAGDLQNLDLSCETPPVQRSLGVCWDIKLDTFTFKVSTQEKPYTRRGILSVTNSLYDPLGFVAPVVIEGKHFMRNVMVGKAASIAWDEPLPPEREKEWYRWRDSLQSLSDLHIVRSLSSTPLREAKERELHVFADASDIAIAAVAYLKVVNISGGCEVSFVLGKSKLAPTHATTTPRLELCAAVLATEVYELIRDEIDLDLTSVRFYSDSKVTLGYVKNETKRFYVYVSNRVERIRRTSDPEQWSYISTDINPADLATRPVAASDLASTTWLTGPKFLKESLHQPDADVSEHTVSLDKDPEVRQQVSTHRTQIIATATLGSERFARFSCWKRLVRAVGNLIHIVKTCSGSSTAQCVGWHTCKGFPSLQELEQAQNTIIKSVQIEAFQTEYDCLTAGLSLPKDSATRSLRPFIDGEGLLRVGGRLNRSDLPCKERNPLILPGTNHVSTLLIRHYHDRVKHQGRIFTQGAVRAAGFWIVGERRLMNRMISACVKCRKLRGKQETQLMSDLPVERLTPEPPFSYVGLDVFGPWTVTARRTRGGQAHSKRWAILFTCMVVRAVHIEVIEEMDASTTINALRRFFAIRGPAKVLRSDNGTNFVGACNELSQPMSKESIEQIDGFLIAEGCKWEFNPPHSSHMGGVWERMIGVTRRVLDAMFKDLGPNQLTHDVLTTFMAEVSAIINARPLVPISYDPEAPEILTPAALLTQKINLPTASPSGEFVQKDLYTRQWRRVQYLAGVFWARWRKEYLPTLQHRRKWQDEKDNVEAGDFVLMKESNLPRNEWPVGYVVSVQPSDDYKVRKVDVKIVRNNVVKTFRRPVSELIVLMKKDVK